MQGKEKTSRMALKDLTNFRGSHHQRNATYKGHNHRSMQFSQSSDLGKTLSFKTSQITTEQKRLHVVGRTNNWRKQVPNGVQCIDNEASYNALDNAQYAHEVIINYRNRERKYMPIPNYLDFQYDIDARMRAKLIDWLVHVQFKLRLQDETLHLSVNFIDRYLSIAEVRRSEFQLVGITAMYIAVKYNEHFSHHVKAEELSYICQKAYSRDQILMFESKMLIALNFDVSAPSTHAFLKRFLKAAQHGDHKIFENAKNAAHYLTQLALYYHCMTQFLPSMRAAAAVRIVMNISQLGFQWTSTMVYYSGGYEEEDLKECVRMYYKILENEKEMQGKEKTSLAKKYGVEAHKFISTSLFEIL